MGIDQERLRQAYVAARPESRRLHERACRALPGGDSRSVVHFDPFPSYMQSGAGCYVTDVDGHRYLDLVNNYTSLVLGHCPPPVVEAVQQQIRLGSAFAAPTELQVTLAEIIRERVPSMEQIRFGNSGTEATLHAMRLARIYTGRRKIIAMEGGYHGGLRPVEIESLPRWQGGQLSQLALPKADDGCPPPVDEMVLVPFNDEQTVRQAVARYGDDLAAIVVEPMMGSAGAIPAQAGYLQLLRELATRAGALLIFDEIQTLRMSVGGAQALYGVRPDLTCLGKIIGGGFPVGAFGGAREIMGLYSPKGPHISHSGTFNANPVTMAAGIATLRALDEEAIARLNAMAARLREGLLKTFAQAGIHGQVTGMGSIMNVHPNAQPVVDHASAQADDQDMLSYLHLFLMEKGMFLAPRGMFCLSTPMTDGDLERFVEAFHAGLDALYPAVAEARPDLLLR